MGDFVRFIVGYFRGWKRKVGCMTLFFACMAGLDMFGRLAATIEPASMKPLYVGESAVVVFLFTFISAYFLLSKPPPLEKPVNPDDLSSP